MRTIKQIMEHCNHLDSNNMAGYPLLLSEEEITMLYRAFCSKEDADRKDDYVGSCRGLFMGHPVLATSDWPGSQLWSTEYTDPNGNIMPSRSSEPVRVGDTIKTLLAGWKIDPIEP